MQRERLTITLDTELLAAVDTTIDHSQIRNRSHAIEHAVREGLALHELTQAVVIGSNTEALPTLCTLLDQFPIQEYIIVAPSQGNGMEIVRSIEELSKARARLVPADFGSGAALLLNKAQLVTTFLYIHLDSLILPSRIIPAYVFHRRNRGIVTHLVQPVDQGFSLTGVSLIEPEICESIPAGMASLEETIFPNLAKAGRVMTYVSR